MRDMFDLFNLDEVRTGDNVRLKMGLAIRWRVFDIDKLVRFAKDVRGDIIAETRSTVLTGVGQVTLQEFLLAMEDIVETAFLRKRNTTTFFSDRGVDVFGIEVTSFRCLDEGTQRELQRIVEESTNRIVSLERQTTDDEVLTKVLAGQLEQEQLRTELVKAEATNAKLISQSQGDQSGAQVGQSARTFS